MTRKEARDRVGIRDLKPKEVDDLKKFASQIYSRILGPTKNANAPKQSSETVKSK